MGICFTSYLVQGQGDLSAKSSKKEGHETQKGYVLESRSTKDTRQAEPFCKYVQGVRGEQYTLQFVPRCHPGQVLYQYSNMNPSYSLRADDQLTAECCFLYNTLHYPKLTKVLFVF